MMTRLRGGFRSTVRSASGTGKAGPTSRRRRLLGNALTVALLLVGAALLLRRFGAFR